MIFSKLQFFSWAILILFIVAIISCGRLENKTRNEIPVFSDQIAPIIYKHCTSCHRPGAGAPFDLIAYEDLRKRLQTIKLSINSRSMPPWPADTSYSRFRDEKVLTQNELDLLNRWIDGGAPIGKIDRIPPPPQNFNNSMFSKPDMTISILNPVQLTGNNKDHFLMVKVPFELPSDTFIRAIEIIPGNKKLVHHINAHLVQYEKGMKKNQYSGKPEVDTELFDKREAYEILDLKNDDGTYPLLTPSVTNYLPGVEASFYPEGIGGYHVKKTSALLLDNIHYGPTPVDTSDQTSFNIFFSPRPPERPTREFILGTSGISDVHPKLIIPPDSIMKFVTSYTLPEKISLLTINPHMHLLGISFKAFSVTPGRDTIPLIHISRWDFRWQYFYTFKSPVILPKGTTILVEGVYDNTPDNPLNPNHPPKQVSEREGSMRTTDEMFQLICTYIPYRIGDENVSLVFNK